VQELKRKPEACFRQEAGSKGSSPETSLHKLGPLTPPMKHGEGCALVMGIPRAHRPLLVATGDAPTLDTSAGV
jgi:hypothetical protein